MIQAYIVLASIYYWYRPNTNTIISISASLIVSYPSAACEWASTSWTPTPQIPHRQHSGHKFVSYGMKLKVHIHFIYRCQCEHICVCWGYNSVAQDKLHKDIYRWCFSTDNPYNIVHTNVAMVANTVVQN